MPSQDVMAATIEAALNFFWKQSSTYLKSRGKKKIFISHKAANHQVVEELQDLLRGVIPGVAFLVSQELPKGHKWRERLIESIKQSDAIILVFTDPDDKWDWCMFETGMFHAFKPDYPIYCIHHAANPIPSPIDNIQGIKLEGEDVTKWLSGLSNDYSVAAAPGKSGIDLPKVAENIVALFPPKLAVQNNKHAAFVPVGQLHADTSGLDLTKWEDPTFQSGDWSLRKSRIAFDRESARFLGLGNVGREISLEKFCNELDAEDHIGSVWVRKFQENIIRTFQRLEFEQEVVYFRSKGGESWRPIISDVTMDEKGKPLHCRVVFIHSLFVPTNEAKQRLQMLADGLRLGVRTRLEVIEKFMKRLDEAQVRARLTPAEILDIRYQIVSALTAIRSEYFIYRMSKDDTAGSPFEGSKHRIYEGIASRFQPLWTKLQRVTPVDDTATDDTYECLKMFKRLNREYMNLVVPEFIKRGGYKLQS